MKRQARLSTTTIGAHARSQLAALATVAVLLATFHVSRGTALAQDATPPPAEGEAAPTESMADSTASEEEMADAQARAHFRVGRTLYDAGRFAEAAVEFQAAYGLSGRPDLLYNIYLAHRDAQDTEAAMLALRNYLAAVADAPDREHLEARLAALEAIVAQEQADAEARERERVAAETRIAQARAQAEANRARNRPLWPWAIVGSGVALATAGIIMSVIAGNDADALRRACDPEVLPGTLQCNPTVGLESRRSDLQVLAGVGDALWITGAVAGVTGLILFFILPDEVPPLELDSLPTVSAACGPTGCFGTLEGSF